MSVDYDELKVYRERTRVERLAFGDALVEWVRVGAGEAEAIEEVRRICAVHEPRGGRSPAIEDPGMEGTK